MLGEVYAAPAERVQQLLSRAPSKQLGFSAVDLTTDSEVVAHRAEVPFKPASVLKILTSAVALEELGTAFRYQTDILADRTTGELSLLAVKGAGDPSLTIESAWLIARRLRLMGIRKVGQLIADDTFFLEERAPKGQRAYQTGASALSFNFNALAISICPSTAGSPAIVVTDPWEAGAIVRNEITTSRGGGRSYSVDQQSTVPLRYHARGSLPVTSPCRTVYRSVPRPAQYFLDVFEPILESVGIQVDSAKLSVLPDTSLRRLFSHQSKMLPLIVQDLNHFSNNFIAEQLLYTLGGQGRPIASRVEGLARMGRYLTAIGVDASQFHLADASGLSHDNRLSAKAVTQLLARMFRNEALRPEFESSLAVGGKSGTLRDRDFGSDIVVRAKTGTIDGVSSLAGFVTTKRGRTIAFAILQNGVVSKDAATRFEDDIVRAIHAQL